MENSTPTKLINYIQYQENSVVSKKIIEKDKGGIIVFAFDKEQKLSEHTTPFDAFITVIEGVAEIIIGGKSNKVSEGESIIMPANVPHAVFAHDKFKMLLTMIKA